jgi:sporulation protein YunB
MVLKLIRWSGRVDPRKVWALLTLLLGVGLALVVIVQLNARLRPLLLELALSQTSNTMTAAIDRVVSAQAVAYTDLVTLERAESGEVVALTSNMAQANLLRTQLLDAALTALDGLGELEVSIPLGTIFDVELLSGLGPTVRAKVLYTGTAAAELENEFSAAGINQTCHQIYFHISADVTVLLPGGQYRTSVNTRVCVAQTLIIGKVPETYLQLDQ